MYSRLNRDQWSRVHHLRVRSILMLLTAFTMFSTAASCNDTYEVEKFEVFGIRMGMTPEELKQQLTSYFSLNPDGFFIKMVSITLLLKLIPLRN